MVNAVFENAAVFRGKVDEWLGGPEARSLLCLDEAHKATHLIPTACKHGSLLTARRVEELQAVRTLFLFTNKHF